MQIILAMGRSSHDHLPLVITSGSLSQATTTYWVRYTHRARLLEFVIRHYAKNAYNTLSLTSRVGMIHPSPEVFVFCLQQGWGIIPLST